MKKNDEARSRRLQMPDASLYINWLSYNNSGTVTKLRQIILCQAAEFYFGFAGAAQWGL